MNIYLHEWLEMYGKCRQTYASPMTPICVIFFLRCDKSPSKVPSKSLKLPFFSTHKRQILEVENLIGVGFLGRLDRGEPTLSPTIMVQWKIGPLNERKLILEGPIFHFHDYGRKGNLKILRPGLQPFAGRVFCTTA